MSDLREIVRSAIRAPHLVMQDRDSATGEPYMTCTEWEADAVLEALRGAGYVVLPPGGDATEQWSVRRDDPYGGRLVMEPGTEREARVYFADQLRFEADRVALRQPAELVRRAVTVWPDGSELTTAWSPIDPPVAAVVEPITQEVG